MPSAWENYYLMMGPSAAALIGLLFVVASLSGQRESTVIRRGTHIYASPIVFHLGVVVLMSAVAMIPHISLGVVSIMASVCAVTGIIYAAVVAKLLRGDPPPPGFDWTDFWFYGVGPFLLYLLMAVTALCFWIKPTAIPLAVGLLMLGLLILSVRNAWDLVTYLAPHSEG